MHMNQYSKWKSMQDTSYVISSKSIEMIHTLSADYMKCTTHFFRYLFNGIPKDLKDEKQTKRIEMLDLIQLSTKQSNMDALN